MEMHAIHALASPARIEAGAEGEERIPTLSSNSYNGGLVRVPRYDLPIAIDLDGVEGLGVPHPIYRNHDESKILGSGVTTREGNSLQTDGEISNTGEHVDEVIRLGKRNYPFQASVGNQPTRLEKIARNKPVELNGQTLSSPTGFYIARESYLTEVSVVSTGADRTTTTTIAASAAPTTKRGFRMDFDTYLTNNGFAASELSETQLNPLRAAYDNQRGSDGDVQTSIDKVLEAARDKEQRGAAYGRIIASALEKGMDSETAEKLVEAAKSDSLSPTEFELQVLRLGRHQGSTRAPSASASTSPEILEAALARAAGFENIEAEYSETVLEASEKHYRHGLTLGELLQLSARNNGYSSVSNRDLRPLLEAAFAPVKASSTYDVAGLLSNVANKSLRQGFLAVESSWRAIADIESVSDLKKHTIYSLGGDYTYKEVARGGEIKHAKMSSETFENQAKTRAIMFEISEDDLLNDDLGAFRRVRRLLGRGAAQSLNQIAWTTFLADVSTFWTSGRGNYISGASSALDVDSLSTAVTTFNKQVDADGLPMGVSPKVLVVPTELAIQAGRLVKDEEVRINGASAKTTYTTGNPHSGKFTVAASSYLSNTQIPNSSATRWFLLGDPLDIPTLQLAFLNGQQLPRIENVALDSNRLGIGMRAVHRFGAAKMDYRASVAAAGA